MEQFADNQRYDHKEAENEAFWLKCIVESGNASNYNEAEATWYNIDPQDKSERTKQFWSAITELYNQKTAEYQEYLAEEQITNWQNSDCSDFSHDHTHNPELKEENIHHCHVCHQQLTPVFPDLFKKGCTQYENALRINFDGSYDMFIDPPFMFDDEQMVRDDEKIKNGETDDPLSLVICHDCAHDLCKKVPWIGKLLNPSDSHAHPYGKDWSGHEGWDLPHDEDVDS